MNKDSNFITNEEDRLFKRMAEVFKKEDAKRLALKWNVQDALDRIKLVEYNVYASEHCKCVRAPTTLYEWSMEEFNNLMNADGFLLNLLRFEEPEVLANAKLLVDLQNLQTYLNQMCTEEVDQIILQLNGCQKVINILETLQEEYATNSVKSKEITLGMSQQELKSKMESVKHFLGVRRNLDLTLNRFMIENPLHYRTCKNYMDAHLPFVEDKAKFDENQVIKEIAEWTNNTRVMEYTYQNTLDYYDVENQHYKEKIQYWNHNFEMRDEQLNLTINNLKDHLQNLYVAWDDMREQVEYFRVNIQRKLEEIDKNQFKTQKKAMGQAISKAKSKTRKGAKNVKRVEK
ncbi:uncharacterized protein ACN427_012968 isoform 2-T4 [Glossina fuscipes fuscipes]